MNAYAKKSKTCTKGKVWKDCDVHGDPHFENILVDASIPEDPVVVSIDPSYPDPEAMKKVLKTYAEVMEIKYDEAEGEKDWLLTDRTYDYAKLLMSSWLLYSVAAIDGFSINGKKKCRIRLRNDRIIEDNRARAGASGAGVNAVTNIPGEVMRYHNKATQAIVQEFVDELPARFGNGSQKEHANWGRLMVVRLWALTIHAGFAVCSLMYPDKANGACSLYLITASLFERGTSAVNKAISGRCNLSARELAAKLLAPRFPAVKTSAGKN